MKKYMLLSCLMSSAVFIAAQTGILLEGNFNDWQNVTVTHSDGTGDPGWSGIDFNRLWVTNDDDFIYLSVEVGKELNLQDDNGIQILIDGDNDSNTGLNGFGIGAELTYFFGERYGQVFVNGASQNISHAAIGLVTIPTVTSDRFEMAIRRDLVFSGQSLFQGNTVKIVFRDDGTAGDVLPNGLGGASYTLMDDTPVEFTDYSLKKTDSEQFRILSYNVLFNGLLEAGRAPIFERILNAIEPDIIGFQEIYDFNSGQVANQVESMLPSGPGETWYHAKTPPDCIAVSRYPITGSYPITGANPNQGNGAFLLDLRPEFDTDLLLLVAHPPCCGNNIDRQYEIDAMMAFVRDAKAGNGPVSLAPNTPIVIAGDMNLVGFQEQLQTFLTGNIQNESDFGNDFQPDWDGSHLKDVNPYNTNLPMAFTWFNEGSDFSPGKLDFIFYTNSVLDLHNTYTLFTRSLPADSLSMYGMFAQDAINASDHLPVVADFSLKAPTSIAETSVQNTLFKLSKNYPNPFQDSTTIEFELKQKAFITLSVHNEDGKKIATLIEENKMPGVYQASFDGSPWPAGNYLIKMQAGDFTATEKMVLIKN